jgi:hypothetical protein
MRPDLKEGERIILLDDNPNFAVSRLDSNAGVPGVR